MNIQTNRTLSRRSVLKAAGATIALPFLEAMIPTRAFASASTTDIPARTGFFYFGTGMNMREFEPVNTGLNFTYPRILKPLEAFRNQTTILSGTWLKHGGGHTGDYTFSTGVDAFANGGQIKNSISADQVIAEQVGSETRFPSLQLSIKRGTGFGSNLRTLSWSRNGVPLASENDPGILFNRLFGRDDPAQQTERDAGFRRKGSILDNVLAQARKLETRISSNDREKLDEYLTSVREVEHQLQREIDWSVRPKPEPADLPELGDYSKPATEEEAKPFSYARYSKLMYDLIALAFQTDSTRVVTYVVRQESSGGVFEEFGVDKGYHALSHHGNDPRNLDQLAQVDTIYMEYWRDFLKRLDSIKEVDGSSLLDHTLLGFSSGMGIGHSKDRLPTALFGGKACGVRHQGHLVLQEQTPLSAVWHTMVDRAGIQPQEPFQDSPGVIKELVG